MAFLIAEAVVVVGAETVVALGEVTVVVFGAVVDSHALPSIHC